MMTAISNLPYSKLITIMLALACAAAAWALPGCSQITTPAQAIQQGPIIQLVTRDTTVGALVSVKPTDRLRVAQSVANISKAIGDATKANPNLTSIQSLVRPLVAKEIAKLNTPYDTPYALIITLIFSDAADLADQTYLQALATATATDKGKMAQSLIQSITAGVQSGANFVIVAETPPATQPQ